MSDPCGNLLFYIDADTIRDATHQPMAGGIDFLQSGSLGYPATRNGETLIVPNPGNPDQYYVFYIDVNTTPTVIPPYGRNNLSYFMVDMNANGGLGVVNPTGVWLTGGGPTNLDFRLTRGMAGTLHANGEDYWVLVFKHGPDEVWAFQVTATGVLPPVISPLPSLTPTNMLEAAISISPDGNKIAITRTPPGPPLGTILADFDPQNGTLSNPIVFPIPTISPTINVILLRECTFSPDGSKLYYLVGGISTLPPIFQRFYLSQIDISNGNSTQIVPFDTLDGANDLQLAKDGRIYFGYNFQNISNYISYLASPNQSGAASGYTQPGISLTIFPGILNGYYLPNFLSHYFRPLSIEKDSSQLSGGSGGAICLPDSAFFRIEGAWGIDSIRWDFGDPASGPITFSGDSAAHLYSAPGLYSIEALVYRGCPTNPDTLYDTLLVRQRPVFDLGADSTLCQGDMWELQLPAQDSASFLWQDGSTADSLLVSGPGLYWVEVANACDTLRDSASAFFDSPISLNLGPDAILCQGDTVFIDLPGSQASYLWEDGSTDSSRQLTQAGLYTLTATNACGTEEDSLELSPLTAPNVALGADTLICAGNSLLLDATQAAATYLWSTGDTTPTLEVSETGSYSVVVSNFCGTSLDTLELEVLSLPEVALGADTTLCEGQSLLLDAFDASTTSYLWSTGDTSSSLNVSATACYEVILSNLCGEVRDTLCLSVEEQPILSLGADTTLCQGTILALNASLPNAQSYLWQDGSEQSQFVVSEAGSYQVQVQTLACEVADSINIAYLPQPSVSLGNDTLLCDETPLLLDASFAGARYFWTTGDTTALIRVTEAGAYGVQVQNICGTAEDMIQLDRSLPPTVDLGDDQTLCEGDITLLDATFTDASYLWQDSSGQAVLTVSEPGLYEVLLQNACGSASDAVEIRYETLPALSLPNDTLICEDKVLIVSPSVDDLNIMWEDGSTEPRRELTQPGLYILTASNSCATLSDSLLLETRDCNCTWFVPTIFTPNNDGTNETMELGYQCDILEFELSIYDRWGVLVYRTDAPENAWDGRSPKGRPCSEGAYAWVIRTRFNGATENAQRIEKGTVVIVR